MQTRLRIGRHENRRRRTGEIGSKFNRISWLLTPLIIYAVGTIVLTGSPVALGETTPTLDQIYRALHVDRIPAAYVVLVDTSSSMMGDGMYTQAKSFLRSFEAALSPQDSVTYYTFDSSVKGPYISPQSLPATATGSFTDFGPAIARALSTLSAAADRGDQVGGLFVLSDGVLDAPSTDTRYLTLHSSGWAQLRATAAVVGHQMTLYGYGLTRRVQKSPSSGAGHCAGMATTDPSTCAGVQQVLTSVIGPNVLVFNETSHGQISSMLNLAQSNERRAKAIRRLLSSDDHQNVSATITANHGASLRELNPSQGGAPVSVILTSHIPDFPDIEVSRLTATSVQGYPVTLVGVPTTIHLTRQTQILHARLRWTIPDGSGLLGGRMTLAGQLRITGRISSPWTPVIRTTLIPAFTLGRLAAPKESYAGSFTRGISLIGWTIVGGMALFIILLCIATYLSSVPTLRNDLELVNLANDQRSPLIVHGHRVWKKNLEEAAGGPGRIIVRGARQGAARITVRREVGKMGRSGRGKLPRDGILVLASLVFRPSDQSSFTHDDPARESG